jgi:hypothetical protein
LKVAKDRKVIALDIRVWKPSGAVYVKWTEQVGVYLHVWKSNWRMTENSTVPMSVTLIDDFNAAGTVRITSEARTLNEGSALSMDINEKNLPSFLYLFDYAKEMTISFAQPNEPQWRVKMRGGSDAVSSFRLCIARLRNAASDTRCGDQNAYRRRDGASPFC